jgi:hypothetical protein
MTLDESSVLIPGVPETRFARQIFWLGLHRRTIPGGSMLPTFHPEYSQPEAQLLAQVGRARRLPAIDEEIRILQHQQSKQNGFRRQLKFRWSTRRLRRTAAAAFARANEGRRSGLLPT